MFGYIRPLNGELRVRELERFKACYCGLCHTLKEQYGFRARFVLSYELVFLSMLLWDKDDIPVVGRGRCAAGLCRSKRCCRGGPSLEMCAGYNVILAWWKLRDTIADEGFVKGLPYRLASLALSGAYKKAARRHAGFDGKVRQELEGLAEYEAGEGRSLDGAADKFARILAAAVPESLPEGARRPMLELLYHLGRWVYIIDACDDYAQDVKYGRYNPVAARYPPVEGKIADSDLALLKTTLVHSNNLLCLAFDLIDENAWSDIIRNMIYLGMPNVCEHVLRGEWPVRGKPAKNSSRNGID